MRQIDRGQKIGIQRRRLGQIFQRRHHGQNRSRSQDGADAARRAIALGVRIVQIIGAVVGVVSLMELLRDRAGVRHGGQHRGMVVVMVMVLAGGHDHR